MHSPEEDPEICHFSLKIESWHRIFFLNSAPTHSPTDQHRFKYQLPCVSILHVDVGPLDHRTAAQIDIIRQRSKRSDCRPRQEKHAKRLMSEMLLLLVAFERSNERHPLAIMCILLNAHHPLL